MISIAMSPDDRTALIDWLRERDVECPGRKYNLHGLTEPRCPECGQAIPLAVTLVDVYATAWVTRAVAICGSAGMGLVFACIVARQGLPHEGRLLDETVMFFMAMIPTPLPLLWGRRRSQRLPRPVQWSIAGGVAAIVIFALAVLCVQLT